MQSLSKNDSSNLKQEQNSVGKNVYADISKYSEKNYTCEKYNNVINYRFLRMATNKIAKCRRAQKIFHAKKTHLRSSKCSFFLYLRYCI